MYFHHGTAGKLTQHACAGLHVCVQHGMSGRQRNVHEQMHPSGSLLVPRHVPQCYAVCADHQSGEPAHTAILEMFLHIMSPNHHNCTGSTI